jgi:FixJ family two-component response regulator
MPKHPVISTIDDDLSLGEGLPDLTRARRLAAKMFESAEELPTPKDLRRNSCLIVDTPMSKMSGTELRHCLVTEAPLFRRPH